MQRHKADDPILRAEVYDNQVMVNARILELAAKHGVKVIATNDVHFINEEDARPMTF